MQITFDKEYLRELYEKGKTSEKKYRFPSQIVSRYQLRIKTLEQADNNEEKIEETLTYNGIKQTPPYSVSSLVLGILSLLLLNVVIGVVLGFIGLYQANKGLGKYEQYPELYKGNGMLIAAKILCLITVILFGLFVAFIFLVLLGVIALFI